ncbi:uncharacterized protein LOC131600071 isoform X1 [Vicia villosa]|uniref:uncharacterized protein LOC131600071 isoform X1 n=1 Tax=Vicia villosa TaxID=3911 RepID=UPI00273B33BC|nr:uncharacterized protein LOC131600071 isoform X1 [Vicia villosa]
MNKKKANRFRTKRKKGDSKKVSHYSQASNQNVERCQNSSLVDETENVNEVSLLRQKIVEAIDKLEKQKQDNRKKLIDLLMMSGIQTPDLLANHTIGGPIDFIKMIDEKIKEIDAKIASLN